jgi:hypothetical protein
MPTTPAMGTCPQTQGRWSIAPSSDSEMYALDNASASISSDVVENLLYLSVDLVSGLQNPTSFGVREAESIDCI